MSSNIVEGQNALSFSLADASGNFKSLEDFSGQKAVVFFYPKDDTPGCTKEACGFRDLWDEFRAENTAVIGISPDSPASHQKFADSHGLPFVLLCDPDRDVMKAYGAYGEKNMYGKKVQGVIRSTVLIGEDGTVIKHWKRVSKTAEHPHKVLEHIRSLNH